MTKKKTKESVIFADAEDCEAVQNLPLVRAFFPGTTAVKISKQEEDDEALLPALVRELGALHLYFGHFKQKGVKGTKEFWKEQYLTATVEADKAIGKQFRRASTSCHPDKFGDKCAAEFAALTSAYEFLKDSEMRQSYLVHTMRQGFAKSDGTSLALAHDQWIKDHSHSTTGGVEQTRYQEAMQQAQKRTQQVNRVRPLSNCQPLTIQGGLSSMKPRLLGIGKIHGETRKVQLKWQPLQPIEAFGNYCENVVILIDEEDAVVIRRDELEHLYLEHIPEYVKEIEFPSWGIFNVSWYAQLIVDGLDMNTARSDSVQITVLPPDCERAFKERPALIKMAHETTSRLQQEFHLFQTQQPKTFQSDRTWLQQRNVFWHRALGSAQSLIHKLETNLKELDQDPIENSEVCPQLMTLKKIVSDAAVVQPALVDAMEFLNKKATRKSFAQDFAVKLAKGIAGTWLSKVSKGGLAKLGGDVNRLYQLLTQGKAASLFLDSASLRAAASRTDLFSSKQCKTLFERSDEMEAEKQAELDLAVKEQLEKEAAEKKGQGMKLKAKKEPKGTRQATNPKVVGLKSDLFVPNNDASIPSQQEALKEQKDDQQGLRGLDQDDRENNGVNLSPSTSASTGTTPSPNLNLPLKYGLSGSQSTSGMTNFGALAPIGSGRSAGRRQQEKNDWDITQDAPFLPLLSTLDAGFSKPPSSMSPLTVASLQSDSSNAPGLLSLQEPVNASDPLLEFLRTQKDCLKHAPKDFYNWLLSEDVTSVGALAEAVACNLFLGEMKNNGLKGFKRLVFKKNCLSAAADSTAHRSGLASKQLIGYLSGIGISKEKFYKIDQTAPRDLQCPISFLLMVVDPVVASDGHTYERHSLEDWITSRRANGEPASSPLTGAEFLDLSVRPNTSVRNIAREFLMSKT